MIGNLRNMATDMGTEVQNQNHQLDRINLKVRFFFLKFCMENFKFYILKYRGLQMNLE